MIAANLATAPASGQDATRDVWAFLLALCQPDTHLGFCKAVFALRSLYDPRPIPLDLPTGDTGGYVQPRKYMGRREYRATLRSNYTSQVKGWRE